MDRRLEVMLFSNVKEDVVKIEKEILKKETELYELSVTIAGLKAKRDFLSQYYFCVVCGKRFTAKRTDKKTCSNACRKKLCLNNKGK